MGRLLSDTEDAHAIAFVEAFRRQWPAYADDLYHTANEYDYARDNGKLTGSAIYKAKKRERMGVVAGVSDYFLALPRSGFHGLFLELKKPDGTLKPEQTAFLSARAAHKYACCVAWGWPAAIKAASFYFDGWTERPEALAFTQSDFGSLSEFTLAGTRRKRLR